MKFSTFLFIALSIVCLNIFSVYSQQYMVKGKVTDEQTGALIGVNVLVKGTTVGTVTDNQGNYNIRFEFQDAILVFSYVGYQTQEISVSGRTEINVVLLQGIEFTEIFVLGSRSLNRSITETPVPIDVINIPDLTNKLGQFDVNQILQYNAPSFNSTRQSGADGADHIDPATLRGLGPDQTLVLINGRRRHQSSLINIFGSRGRGNTGTDLNAIPLASIERIEILRDGASAQYGSDAIAGVVNVVLKSNINKLTGSVGT